RRSSATTERARSDYSGDYGKLANDSELRFTLKIHDEMKAVLDNWYCLFGFGVRAGYSRLNLHVQNFF
ncbi:hypothetical protein, partial [Endozoicomonas acroporae]|uniref:hypothetical protein n=1 Tax=Endozoicomonas acroporae TaxID=1701104 RepID=UPI003D78DB6E